MESPRVNPLRIALILLNAALLAVLLAIPIGKLLGVLEAKVPTAAIFGWLLFFVPALASALALWGLQFSKPGLTRRFVVVAMPGSFLAAFVSLYACWEGPAHLARMGIGFTILFSLDVLALWLPFKDRLESATSASQGGDEDR